MLSTGKILLEFDLKQAFYDAYMTQFNTIEKGFDNSGDKIDAKTKMEKMADEFSKSLAKDMATAIYDFVKQISITATIPPTVIAPSGPVTGTIPMTSFTIL